MGLGVVGTGDLVRPLDREAAFRARYLHPQRDIDTTGSFRQRMPRMISALIAVLLISCVGQPGTITPADQPPAATKAPAGTGAVLSAPAATAPLPTRAIASYSGGIAASGDFRGNGKQQVALLRDPVGDLSLKIALLERGASGDQLGESSWYSSGPNFFALSRTKLTVLDVTNDGKDDLVALYSDGPVAARLLVFRSTGTAFELAGIGGWWKSDGYAWSRVQALLGGTFREGGPPTIAVVYQYDSFQVRVHAFESTGSAFTYTGNQGIFDTGVGQYDATKARFTVGRFTRTGGPDQIAALYQYPNFRVRLHVLDPLRTGTLATVNGWNGLYDSGEGQYDLGRASVTAADADGDGKSDLFSLYSYTDGSARLHVFEGAAGYRANFAGAAAIPTGLVCAGASGFVSGDWDGDKKSDGAALTFVAGTGTKTSVLQNAGSSYRLTAATDVRCDRWPLTGLVSNGARTNVRPLYVKIDNNPTARPHYGITKADMVFEWLVEGFTTRLAAVYQSQDPDEIGSVRSGRHTDRPIVPAFRGALVYSGAAGEETEGFAYDHGNNRYIDLKPAYGWAYRVGIRPAPYNFFSTGPRIREAIASTGVADPTSVPPWDFLATATGDPLAGGFSGSVTANSVVIPYRALFGVEYRYDAASRSYARFQNGVREVDGANGQAVAARNILAIQTDVELTDRYGLDAAGSMKVDMRLVGTGTAYIFRDGRRQAGTWSRPDIWDPYTFTNTSGEKIFLSPGQTWIHIVPKEWTIPSE